MVRAHPTVHLFLGGRMVWSLATQLPAPHESVVFRGHQINHEFRIPDGHWRGRGGGISAAPTPAVAIAPTAGHTARGADVFCGLFHANEIANEEVCASLVVHQSETLGFQLVHDRGMDALVDDVVPDRGIDPGGIGSTHESDLGRLRDGDRRVPVRSNGRTGARGAGEHSAGQQQTRQQARTNVWHLDLVVGDVRGLAASTIYMT